MKLTQKHKDLIASHKDMLDITIRTQFKGASEEMLKDLKSQFYYEISTRIFDYDENISSFSTYAYNIIITYLKNYFYRNMLEYKPVEDKNKMTLEQVLEKEKYDNRYNSNYEKWEKQMVEWRLAKEKWDSSTQGEFLKPKPVKPKGGRYSVFIQHQPTEFNEEVVYPDNIQEYENEYVDFINTNELEEVVCKFDAVRQLFYHRVFQKGENSKTVSKELASRVKNLGEYYKNNIETMKKITGEVDYSLLYRRMASSDPISKEFISRLIKEKNIDKVIKDLTPQGGCFLREIMFKKMKKKLNPLG